VAQAERLDAGAVTIAWHLEQEGFKAPAARRVRGHRPRPNPWPQKNVVRVHSRLTRSERPRCGSVRGHRELVTSVDDPDLGPVRMQNVLFRMSETPGSIRFTGRPLGADTDAVLSQELGLDLTELRERGIVA
jgi:hypothetical protein